MNNLPPIERPDVIGPESYTLRIRFMHRGSTGVSYVS